MNKIKRFFAAIGSDFHIPWHTWLGVIGICIAAITIISCLAITIGMFVNYLTETEMTNEETLNLGLGIMFILIMIGGVITYLIKKWKELD